MTSILIPAAEHQWHPLDGVPAPEYVPPCWVGWHVGQRLKEAFETLFKVPVPPGPADIKSPWPLYQYDEREYFSTILALLGEGLTPADHEITTDRNRVRIPASAEDIGRMEAAIGWPCRYLLAAPILVKIVSQVACYRARGLDIGKIALRLKRGPTALRVDNRQGLDIIAAGLRRDGVEVF